MAQPHTTQLSQLTPATGACCRPETTALCGCCFGFIRWKNVGGRRREKRGERESSRCNAILVLPPWSLLLIPLFDICLGRNTRRHKTCILNITSGKPPGSSLIVSSSLQPPVLLSQLICPSQVLGEVLL